MLANVSSVTVIEQPGLISQIKARRLSDMITQLYFGNPELRAEVDRRLEEMRRRKEIEHAGNQG